VSDLTPQEEDFGLVYDYLPAEGHPQDVEEDKCPYCALRRIHSRIAELEAERDEAMATMYHERGNKEQAEGELAEEQRLHEASEVNAGKLILQYCRAKLKAESEAKRLQSVIAAAMKGYDAERD